jgi:hypothetical protein
VTGRGTQVVLPPARGPTSGGWQRHCTFCNMLTNVGYGLVKVAAVGGWLTAIAPAATRAGHAASASAAG